MYLIPTNVLKERLARRWCKMQSQRGPYNYSMGESRVINNKPHIKLERVPMAMPVSPYSMFSPLLGVVRSSSLDDEEEENDLEGKGLR